MPHIEVIASPPKGCHPTHMALGRFFVAFALLIIIHTSAVMAQSGIRGRVTDSDDGTAIPGASVAIVDGEGKIVRGTATGVDGAFGIDSIAAGRFTVKISFIGYEQVAKVVDLTKGKTSSLGNVKLKAEGKELDEVTVVKTVQRQEQRGDTTVFNAAAFKVNPDATTEDLLRKMPGMKVENGQVSHGGETVKKVLVDGKEFFGDDPSVALKNIDANMVEKIEVFDKQSEQAEFTGFSDGNDERTINILTKMGINKGRFGKAYGGYGTDEHYEAGGNMSLFSGRHRGTVLGSLNNVNLNDFSGSGDATGSGGTSTGINTIGSAGVNYNYEEQKKVRLDASYFFSHRKNDLESATTQEYFQEDDAQGVHIYKSQSESESRANSHKVQGRISRTVNERNTIIFAPNFSWKVATSDKMNSGTDTRDSVAYQSTGQRNGSHTHSFAYNSNLTWRHKFDTPRRTLSLSLKYSTEASDSEGDSRYMRMSSTAEAPDDIFNGTTPLLARSADASLRQTLTSVSGQESTNDKHNTTTSAKLMYTEPLGSAMALQLNYAPSFAISRSDKRVVSDTVTAEAVLTDVVFGNMRFAPLLSNKKETRYLLHRAGVGLNIFAGKSVKATLGLDLQSSTLDGEQTYPLEFDTHRSFFSLMPSAELSLSKDKKFVARIRYRSSSNSPTITQLQDVVDVSNIRCFTAGNPDLSQSTTHQVRLQGSANNPETSRMVFVMGSVSIMSDYVGNSTYLLSVDSVLEGGIVLPAGTQFTKPVNISGQVSGFANATFSSPVAWLKSNVSLNLGANMTKTPSLYNGKRVTSRSYSFSGGVNVGSSLSENVDFNVAYNPSYCVVSSSKANASNYNYYRHSIRADLSTLFFSQHLAFSTTLSHNFTSGMGDGYDSNYLLWNASVAYKFLARRQAELRLRVCDILNNAESTSRDVTDAYIQTSQSNVMTRYAMLTFSYKFKQVGQAPADNRIRKGGFEGGRGPGDGPMGGRGRMRD